jgi:hypothetical protein
MPFVHARPKLTILPIFHISPASIDDRNSVGLLPPFLRFSFSRGPGERQIRACGVIPIFTLFTSTLHNLRQPYLARLLTKLLLAMQVVATACLFLAGKGEETPKPLNEVVRVCYLVQDKHEYESALKQIHLKVRPTSCLLTCLHNTRAAQKRIL